MGFPNPRLKIDITEKRPGSRVPAPHDSFLAAARRLNHAPIPRASDFFNGLLAALGSVSQIKAKERQIYQIDNKCCINSTQVSKGASATFFALRLTIFQEHGFLESGRGCASHSLPNPVRLV
jgi:hypothetical protein